MKQGLGLGTDMNSSNVDSGFNQNDLLYEHGEYTSAGIVYHIDTDSWTEETDENLYFKIAKTVESTSLGSTGTQVLPSADSTDIGTAITDLGLNITNAAGIAANSSALINEVLGTTGYDLHPLPNDIHLVVNGSIWNINGQSEISNSFLYGGNEVIGHNLSRCFLINDSIIEDFIENFYLHSIGLQFLSTGVIDQDQYNDNYSHLQLYQGGNIVRFIIGKADDDSGIFAFDYPIPDYDAVYDSAGVLVPLVIGEEDWKITVKESLVEPYPTNFTPLLGSDDLEDIYADLYLHTTTTSISALFGDSTATNNSSTPQLAQTYIIATKSVAQEVPDFVGFVAPVQFEYMAETPTSAFSYFNPGVLAAFNTYGVTAQALINNIDRYAKPKEIVENTVLSEDPLESSTNQSVSISPQFRSRYKDTQISFSESSYQIRLQYIAFVPTTETIPDPWYTRLPDETLTLKLGIHVSGERIGSQALLGALSLQPNGYTTIEKEITSYTSADQNQSTYTINGVEYKWAIHYVQLDLEDVLKNSSGLTAEQIQQEENIYIQIFSATRFEIASNKRYGIVLDPQKFGTGYTPVSTEGLSGKVIPPSLRQIIVPTSPATAGLAVSAIFGLSSFNVGATDELYDGAAERSKTEWTSGARIFDPIPQYKYQAELRQTVDKYFPGVPLYGRSIGGPVEFNVRHGAVTPDSKFVYADTLNNTTYTFDVHMMFSVIDSQVARNINDMVITFLILKSTDFGSTYTIAASGTIPTANLSRGSNKQTIDGTLDTTMSFTLNATSSDPVTYTLLAFTAIVQDTGNGSAANNYASTEGFYIKGGSYVENFIGTAPTKVAYTPPPVTFEVASFNYATAGYMGGTSGGNYNLTINKPSGVSTGDMLVILVATTNSTADTDYVTTPAGFTEVFDTLDTTGDSQISAFYKIVDGTEGSQVTVAVSNGINTASSIGWILHITGAATSSPIDVVGTSASTTSASGFNQGVTTQTDGALCINISAYDGGDLDVFGIPAGTPISNGWERASTDSNSYDQADLAIIYNQSGDGTGTFDYLGISAFVTWKIQETAGFSSLMYYESRLGGAQNSDGRVSQSFSIKPA
jgi:hypothetical protein